MINIGKNLDTKENVEINLQSLIGTRLLIQANSGGGKSYLIRRLLEKSHGKVQQIVIDLEGEFSTLREKHDYLLVGQDGEIPANIRTAELLAKKLMELNVSTIIDLSELKHHERIIFVKRFLDSLINLPKRLWKPCLIIVDEAHQFAPQQSKSESTGSIIDLMTRGRKRGYAGILATQRLSKLHKDAVAECNNKLIGRTGLDIDRKRASEELGFTKKEDEISLRNLNAGEFYAFGASISKEIIKVKIGDVKTTHPEAGKGKLIKASPTPENIKRVLKDIIDLPKEVEEELKTASDFKKKIFELKRELRSVKSSKPKPEIEEEKLHTIKEKAYIAGAKITENNYKNNIREYKKREIIYKKNIENLSNEIKKFTTNCSKLLQINIPAIQEKIHVKKEVMPKEPPLKVAYEPKVIPEPREIGDFNEEINLSPAYQRLLDACAMFEPEYVTKSKIAILTDVPLKTSTFRNGISKLKMSGLIEVRGNECMVTKRGIELASDERLPDNSEDLISMWKQRLSPAYGRMFQAIIDAYPHEISRFEISQKSEVPEDASTFRNGLSKIKTLGLIEVNKDSIKASEEFFQ